jgi:hypothetical protein
MKKTSRRLRVSTLTTGLALLVFASSALIAGCSSSNKPEESVAGEQAPLITIPTPAANIPYKWGTSVAVDNQTLIIGDDRAMAQGVMFPGNRGEVHVYTRNGGLDSWSELQVLKPYAPVWNETHHGSRLSLHGNLLVVSAERDSKDCGVYPCANIADDQSQGAFYVYTRTAPGQIFTQVGTKYLEPTPVANARWGHLVATNGKYIAAAGGESESGSGDAMDVRIFTIQANGSIVYSYSIDATLKPVDMVMTESGILALIPTKTDSSVRTYQLQASQAVALSNSASLGTGYIALTASNNTIAALDGSTGGRVVMAPVSASGVGTVTTLSALGLTQPGSLSLAENQRLFVGDQSTAKLAMYELVGSTWTNTGFIYPPLAQRFVNFTVFAHAVAQTNELVAIGNIPWVHVSSLSTNSPLWDAVFEKQKLLPTDVCGTSCNGQSFANAEFGRESALSGDVAAVTQPDLSNAPTRNPSVHIYNKQSGTWSHTGAFSYMGKRTRDVAVDSNRVYVGVGTPGPTVPGSFLDGSVLVYERNSSQAWQNVATLTASDPTSMAGTQVGDYIAASGDIVAVGAYQFVYIFQRSSSGTWSQIQKLGVTPLSASIGRPHPVALSDTYLVVGAPYDNSVASEQGSVFVYRRSDWGLEQKFGPSFSTTTNSHFGSAVAIDGTTILVGAPDGTSGNVQFLERTGTDPMQPWVYKARFEFPSGVDYRIGTSVSLSGSQALVGAVGDPLTAPGGGAAYLFAKANGEWDERYAHILLPGDYGQTQASYGWGVNLSGTTALVTAPPVNNSSGAAYFYSGLVDADTDGVLAADDCNDSGSVALGCTLGGANLSFEPAPLPQWVAETGSFSLSTTRTDGTTSAQLGTGTAAPKLSSPLFSTTLLHEIGTSLAIDIQRPSSGSNAVTLFFSAPALNINQQAIGTIDLSSFPVGAWKTASLTIPTTLRNVLLNQSTNVRFHLQFNSAAPNLLIDNLRFSGTFNPRAPAPPAGTITATLTATQNNAQGYCVALKLGNSGTTQTSTWSAVVNLQGTTINNGSWNAAFSGTSGTVTISNNQTWNANIPAGATAYDPSVGFCSNRSGTALPTVVSASGQ